ncbi:MAG TPA: 4-hydroxythreonine-4-phosphate dehydrogenase PdxA [Steroidobacteraceae bacterium]|nr:4-hydroxythreonine-4-phosphate dehydrogenase PdxA [Steroidobacteraceae bacterium]
MTRLPKIIVSSGEPAGIGPDLCIALAEREMPAAIAVIGDPDVFADRAALLDRRIEIITLEDAGNASGQIAMRPGALNVIEQYVASPVIPGRLNPANARYVLDMLDHAADACAAGRYDAMVTAPVQKSLIADAGFAFSGHTEYLAARLGAEQPVMMLVAETLRVALATTHLPLAAVSAAITHEALERVLRVLIADLKSKFGIARPRIVVCGLNPHAGEGGHLGREEIEVIAPVLDSMRGEGCELIGPAPADTAFTPRMLERADAVLAMFHDQGLPVLKYAGFGHAINVTLGLPVIRTSVDHGTALDLAGTGSADPGSLVAAVDLAIELARTRV